MAGTPKTTTWKLDPHTAAKHAILRNYLGAWFPVLGRSGWNGRVLFLDGFSGPGEYDGGEPGSPIVALKTLLDHPAFPTLKSEFNFFFYDSDKQRVEYLSDVIEDLRKLYGGWPPNVKVNAEVGAFEQVANDVVTQLESQRKQLAPTFAFIDPFGFSGTPLETISRLLAFDKCEVFFNFMFDHVNRFIEQEPVEHHMAALFGCDDFTAVNGLAGPARKAFIHDLYKRQLHTVGGFEFVSSFEMINKTGHTGYYLFHGTRHLSGLKLMKDSMWRVDPGSGCRFSDRFAGQDVLFGGADVDTGPLAAALKARFAGQDVSVADVEVFTLTETPYSASHWNRRTLVPMEKSGQIRVVSSQRSKNYTYPPGTIVRF